MSPIEVEIIKRKLARIAENRHTKRGRERRVPGAPLFSSPCL